MESLAAAECRIPRRALGGAGGGAAVPARIPSRAARPVRVSSASVSDQLALLGTKASVKRRVWCRGWVEDGQAEGWEQQVRCCS